MAPVIRALASIDIPVMAHIGLTPQSVHRMGGYKVQGRKEQGERIIESMVRQVPFRRLGEPEDIAGAVAYFASDDAAFVTAQVLSVSGGLTMAG